jgi:hypothetical protein
MASAIEVSAVGKSGSYPFADRYSRARVIRPRLVIHLNTLRTVVLIIYECNVALRQLTRKQCLLNAIQNGLYQMSVHPCSRMMLHANAEAPLHLQNTTKQ